MQEIIDALAAEFSDLGDAGQAATVTFRLLLAAVLGGALGFEHESAGKAAGMRTHMLVAIGAAMFLMAVNLAGGGDAESSRTVYKAQILQSAGSKEIVRFSFERHCREF